jgi:hypothetical protein
MDVKAKFLELTTKTYPIGTEKAVYNLITTGDFIKDKYDNLYWIIGKSDTLFCAHLDTVDSGTVGKSIDITHVEEGNMIKTNGKTILGADDKAGVVIMLYMIERKIPGFYLFTVGEEKGCVGSAKLSAELQTKMSDKFKGIKKIIAFDRSGYNSIITHQMQQRCCSDEFALALAAELGKSGLKYTTDTGGFYCDSAEFADIIPECTNISVGYFDQHANTERQDIVFLQTLAEACCNVNWKELPVKRDPKKVEYIDDYYFSRRKKVKEGEDEPEFDDYDFHPFAVEDNKDVEVFYFEDKKYNYISDISYLNGEIIDITLSRKRVEYELEAIIKYMIANGITYQFVTWDGLILIVEHDKGETKLSRNELLEFIPELDIETIKKEKK